MLQQQAIQQLTTAVAPSTQIEYPQPKTDAIQVCLLFLTGVGEACLRVTIKTKHSKVTLECITLATSTSFSPADQARSRSALLVLGCSPVGLPKNIFALARSYMYMLQ